jgi:phosphoenolpyruvate carboxykinase (GTP)
MMRTLKNDKFFPTLFTNTAIDSDTNTPWWEGMTDEVPQNLTDWQGNVFDPRGGKPAAHPNSRFTASIYNCPTLSKDVDNPKGVPISGIIFGGRRSTTVPLVVESFDWPHGVFMASMIGSETTAAATGKVGIVRRDPMAMRPFCGYNMADYFSHWIQIGKKLLHPPKIYVVNWFRKDEAGNFIWPGFRENSRIIKWMIDRIEGGVSAKNTPLGSMPQYEDMNLEGLDFSRESFEKLFEVNAEAWKKEAEEVEKFYGEFGERLPNDLMIQLKKLKESF